MTTDRFNKALKALHWSKQNLADMLGCDIDLIEAYSRGLLHVPPKLSAWLEVLAGVHEDLEDHMPVSLAGKRYDDFIRP